MKAIFLRTLVPYKFLLILALSQVTVSVSAAPVNFPDANLKAVVENKLGVVDPTPTDMLALTFLDGTASGIVDLTGLETATNLNQLRLPINQISDVTPISGLTNLTGLTLSQNLLTDTSGLSSLTNLTALALFDNQISDISGVSGMTNLVSLHLHTNQIVDVSPLSGLANVTFLDLTRNQISDVSGLSGLSSILTLRLPVNQVSDVSPLAGLTTLVSLDLSINPLSDVSSLAGLTNLTALALINDQVSDVTALAGLTNLTGLHMDSNLVVDVTPLAGLTNLTFLALRNNQIIDVSPLSGLINLTFLDLNGNQVSTVSGLSGLSSILNLRLGSNQISDVSPLSGLTTVTTLGLGGNLLSDISALAPLTNLATLALLNNQISDLSSVTGMTNLIVLLINSNQIVDVSPLSTLSNVTFLDAINNQITSVAGLSGLSSILDLRLDGNQITDVSPLAVLSTMTKLRITSNLISDISALTALTNLQVLTLTTNPLNLNAYCVDIPQIESINPGIILLADPSPFPSCNTAPSADAGPNISIAGEDQSSTVINGFAEDPEGDAMTYRWFEGVVELSPSQPVGLAGEADLDLSSVPPLSIGQHILTLEVDDGQDSSSDDMIVTIANSAPNAAPTGGGVYQLNAPVTLGGQVSDFDGDVIVYKWREGATLLFDGQLQAIVGGAPTDLPDHIKSDFSLGVHTVTLTLDDGVNQAVSSDVMVEVIDTTDPTLAPTPDKTILWPPNHKMVDISIDVNADDNSGDPVVLAAIVSSNEPQSGTGDGDTDIDWSDPVIDQLNGQIMLQLRAERSGAGDGRIYTVSITGTDSSGNSSQVSVEIIVPHSKGKK